ncbi:MAG: hypothetical protein JWO12_3286 [Frankiales bacterium]|nr:hypothetical protein [Frankiales bacterium]
MILKRDQPMYALEQTLMAHTDQGAYDRYEDRWEGAEDFIAKAPAFELEELREQIAEAFATLEPAARFTYFKLSGEFGTPEEFDEWLRTLDRRMEQAIAGDHSQPLEYPDS